MYWISAQVSIICVCEYEYTIMEVVTGISKSSSKHTMRMLRNMDVKPIFKILISITTYMYMQKHIVLVIRNN